jgi:hypothetical protein
MTKTSVVLAALLLGAAPPSADAQHSRGSRSIEFGLSFFTR